MNLDELAKAIIGSEENAPRFGDILQPGQSVALRVSGIQGVPGDKGDKGDKGDPGQDGRDSTVPGARGIPGQDGADSTVPGPRGIPGKDGADSTVPGPKGERGDRGEKGDKGEKGDPGRSSGWRSLGGGGGGTSGTGLPPGGLPGQVVTNTAPGTGDWRDLPPAGAALTVTDGTTSVANVTQETIFGATVAAGGAGEAIVTVAAGSTPFIGTTPDAPIPLAPVDYVLSSPPETIPAYTYDDGVGGVGATVTEWTTGSVATTSLNFAGQLYVSGDTFSVYGGDGLAVGVVDSVDGLGAVQTYHLTAAGDAYSPTVGVTTTATSGIGEDLRLDILTITVTAAGPVLTADGGSPTVGQRIVFSDGHDTATGIYTVTNVGDGITIPWVLTRSTDCDAPARRCRFWTVDVISGVVFALGSAKAQWWDPVLLQPELAIAAFGANARGIETVVASGGGSYAEGIGAFASGTGARAEGYDSDATGTASHSEGTSTHADGAYSHAEGVGSVATASGSHAEGQATSASGFFAHAEGDATEASGYVSHAEGERTTASGYASHAEGASAVAWGYGQYAHASGGANSPGAAQYSRQVYTYPTVDNTPTVLGDGSNNPLTFPDFLHTCVVRGRIVARRTDTPGTDSAWDFAGVIRGDGVSAYSWVGGFDPVPTVIAQDAAASTWAVAVTISGASIVVTVTGEVGKTIDWMTTIELDEVV